MNTDVLPTGAKHKTPVQVRTVNFWESIAGVRGGDLTLRLYGFDVTPRSPQHPVQVPKTGFRVSIGGFYNGNGFGVTVLGI